MQRQEAASGHMMQLWSEGMAFPSTAIFSRAGRTRAHAVAAAFSFTACRLTSGTLQACGPSSIMEIKSGTPSSMPELDCAGALSHFLPLGRLRRTVLLAAVLCVTLKAGSFSRIRHAMAKHQTRVQISL